MDSDSSSIGFPAESPRVQAVQDLVELHRYMGVLPSNHGNSPTSRVVPKYTKIALLGTENRLDGSCLGPQAGCLSTKDSIAPQVQINALHGK